MGRRAGRKRKSGQREPNGRLKPEKRPDDRVKTSRQPHRRALPDEMRLDERAESPLGRMNLRGEIDGDCYDAGARYAFVVGQYSSTIDAPQSTSGSGRGVSCLAEQYGTRNACRLDPYECTCLRRKDRYMAAYEALAQMGRAALMAVNRVAVHRGEPASAQETVYLVAGLSALARHFGLTASRPRPYRRNAN